jgi:hypothetical protein
LHLIGPEARDKNQAFPRIGLILVFQNIEAVHFARQTEIRNDRFEVVHCDQIDRGFPRICFANVVAGTLEKRDYVVAG